MQYFGSKYLVIHILPRTDTSTPKNEYFTGRVRGEGPGAREIPRF
jgi:hypothetical protein